MNHTTLVPRETILRVIRMNLPIKRRKYNVCSSDGTLVHKADQVSSSPPQPNEPKHTPFVRDSIKTSVTRRNQPQIRSKTANSYKSNQAYTFTQTRGSKAPGNVTRTSLENPKRKPRLEIPTEKNTAKVDNVSAEYKNFADTISKSSGSSGISHDLKTELVDDDDFISDWDEDDVGYEKKTTTLKHHIVKKYERPNYAKRLRNGNEKPYKFHQEITDQHQDNNDLLTWTERFAPTDLQELAVHKRKVADVKSWLEDTMNGRTRQRLLLLKGAPGSGKTITLKLLTESLGYQVLEWQNPVGPLASSDGDLSMSAQFEEFLGRGARFGQLDMVPAHESLSKKQENSSLNHQKSIILIEEFPSTFDSSSTALRSFQSSLLQYLTLSTAPLSSSYGKDSPNPRIPVVMIISESPLSSFTSSRDSFTAHRLLGQSILQHPGLRIIELNPIAPTFLAKALDLILQKESRKSGRKKTPSLMILKKLGEIGDIRSAIESLQFLCLRGDTDGGDWSSRVSLGKSKNRVKEMTITRMEKKSLEHITQREANLGIFHAIGKVMYNRRQDAAPDLHGGKDPENLPNHLYIHSRPKRSLVPVNELMDESGTDSQTFIAALHENYILSCDASPSCFEFSSLDHVNGCIDALSDSDLLCPPWYRSGNAGFSNDLLHTDEISFHVAVRGLLFSLPNPVVRKSQATASGLRKGKSGEAHRMFYPTSLRLWKIREEIESIIDLWVQKFRIGLPLSTSEAMTGEVSITKPSTGIVESWKSISSISSSNNKLLMSAGTSARQELILEHLPYMAKISNINIALSSILTTKEIEKVTSFVGIGESEDLIDENHSMEMKSGYLARNKLGGARLSKKGSSITDTFGRMDNLPAQQLEEKLVISDDDIEDL